MTDRRIYLHKVATIDSDTFIGLKISQKSVDIFIPEFLPFSDINNKKSLKNDVFLLIKSINLIENKDQSKSKTDDNIFESNSFNFLSYVWIIRDYINNGYYKEFEKNYGYRNSGKINWKKTLNSNSDLLKNNIFRNLVYEYKSNVETTLTEAYKVCLYIALSRIGWLFNASEKNVNINNDALKKINFFASIIKKELKRTFVDSKKIRLKEMLKILLSTDSSKNIDECVYGTSNYFVVFEKMIDKVFGNVKNINDYYPRGLWHLEKENKIIMSTNLRPDTICSYENYYCIIDSKYYRFGTTFENKDLPNTTSIEKQIIYAEDLKINHSGNKVIYNIFIMPFDKNSKQAKHYFNREKMNDVEYIGYAYASWKNTNISDLNLNNKVFTFLIDLKYLMEMASLGKKLNFFEFFHEMDFIK